MKVQFKVHNVSTVPVNKPAVVGGEQMLASVNCLEVELLMADGRALTLNFYKKDEVDAATKLFVVDSEVTAEFTSGVGVVKQPQVPVNQRAY